MTDVARQLDARLRELDANTARRLESLVRDALALAGPGAKETRVSPGLNWPVVPATGRRITQKELDDASDDSE